MNILQFFIRIGTDDEVELANTAEPDRFLNIGEACGRLEAHSGIKSAELVWDMVKQAMHVPGFIERARTTPVLLILKPPAGMVS